MAPTPVFLPGEPRGRRSLEGYSPWGGKESDTTEWQDTHVQALCLCDVILFSKQPGRRQNWPNSPLSANFSTLDLAMRLHLKKKKMYVFFCTYFFHLI